MNTIPNQLERILTIIENINHQLGNSLISGNKLHEERIFIKLFKKEEVKLNQLLNKLKIVNINDYHKVHEYLFYLYYEVLDLYGIIESLFAFSKSIIEKCEFDDEPLEGYIMVEKLKKIINVLERINNSLNLPIVAPESIEKEKYHLEKLKKNNENLGQLLNELEKANFKDQESARNAFLPLYSSLKYTAEVTERIYQFTRMITSCYAERQGINISDD